MVSQLSGPDAQISKANWQQNGNKSQCRNCAPNSADEILACKIYNTVISLTNQEIAILVWDEDYGLHSEVETE